MTKGGKPRINYQERGRRILQKIRNRFTTASERSRLHGENVINSIERDSDKLLKTLDAKAGDVAVDAQNAMIKFSSDSTNAYGRYIDKISANLKRTKKEILFGEVEKVGDAIKKQINEVPLPDGAGKTAVNRFLKKYSTKVEKAKTLLYDVSGKPLSVETKATKKIRFRKLLNDINEVTEAIDADLATGVLSPKSLAAKTFDTIMDNFLETRVKGWKALNKRYREFKEIVKKSGKIIKQGKGELETEVGEEFFKKTGMGETPVAQQKFLKRAKAGVKGLTEGIGDIDKEIRDISSKILDNTADIADIKRYQQLSRRGMAKTTREAVERAKTKKFGVTGAEALTKEKSGKVIPRLAKRAGQVGAGVLGYEIVRRDLRKFLGRGDTGGYGHG